MSSRGVPTPSHASTDRLQIKRHLLANTRTRTTSKYASSLLSKEDALMLNEEGGEDDVPTTHEALLGSLEEHSIRRMAAEAYEGVTGAQQSHRGRDPPDDKGRSSMASSRATSVSSSASTATSSVMSRRSTSQVSVASSTASSIAGTRAALMNALKPSNVVGRSGRRKGRPSSSSSALTSNASEKNNKKLREQLSDNLSASIAEAIKENNGEPEATFYMCVACERAFGDGPSTKPPTSELVQEIYYHCASAMHRRNIRDLPDSETVLADDTALNSTEHVFMKMNGLPLLVSRHFGGSSMFRCEGSIAATEAASDVGMPRLQAEFAAQHPNNCSRTKSHEKPLEASDVVGRDVEKIGWGRSGPAAIVYGLHDHFTPAASKTNPSGMAVHADPQDVTDNAWTEPANHRDEVIGEESVECQVVVDYSHLKALIPERRPTVGNSITKLPFATDAVKDALSGAVSSRAVSRASSVAQLPNCGAKGKRKREDSVVQESVAASTENVTNDPLNAVAGVSRLHSAHLGAVIAPNCDYIGSGDPTSHAAGAHGLNVAVHKPLPSIGAFSLEARQAVLLPSRSVHQKPSQPPQDEEADCDGKQKKRKKKEPTRTHGMPIGDGDNIGADARTVLRIPRVESLVPHQELGSNPGDIRDPASYSRCMISNRIAPSEMKRSSGNDTEEDGKENEKKKLERKEELTKVKKMHGASGGGDALYDWTPARDGAVFRLTTQTCILPGRIDAPMVEIAQSVPLPQKLRSVAEVQQQHSDPTPERERQKQVPKEPQPPVAVSAVDALSPRGRAILRGEATLGATPTFRMPPIPELSASARRRDQPSHSAQPTSQTPGGFLTTQDIFGGDSQQLYLQTSTSNFSLPSHQFTQQLADSPVGFNPTQLTADTLGQAAPVEVSGDDDIFAAHVRMAGLQFNSNERDGGDDFGSSLHHPALSEVELEKQRGDGSDREGGFTREGSLATTTTTTTTASKKVTTTNTTTTRTTRSSSAAANMELEAQLAKILETDHAHSADDESLGGVGGGKHGRSVSGSAKKKRMRKEDMLFPHSSDDDDQDDESSSSSGEEEEDDVSSTTTSSASSDD